MPAFYNEIDPYAAQWLRNLIAAGHIAPGVVDERSIEDIEPHEIHRYTQCHFFAGIGVWSRALRLAGWPDDRPVWTGSCPCQPFSAAGKGAGFADERHLWPAWHHLIRECGPAVVFGEQVAAKAVDPWIDLVRADVEALGYAFGAVAFPSAGVGAPHIRDRCYWVVDADDDGSRRHAGGLPGSQGGSERQVRRVADGAQFAGAAGFVGDASSAGLAQRIGERGVPGRAGAADEGKAPERAGIHVGELADDDDAGQRAEQDLRLQGPDVHDADRCGPLSGFWAAADWIPCRDGKWRPVEPGTFPLAHGAPARVGRLRAYGNAIVAPAAAEFIGAYLDGELA
jgi:DNA (cytosine-5)-methyltransferase 1